ncbi:hypothetical protein jhhlp_000833 [Lomentospora prolificans]|uniref:Tyrosinase copper-binding domain-containing protein n=1 Tax=Lomentospora prolificans TaxID=41688 RepID=A0A2N3NJJ7_9PEZI|nr:hypothetical protein jhhlp_000833 [Lomentospora prolificans]
MVAAKSLLAFLAVAIPVLAQGKCSRISQRRAWHTLSNDEKRAYIDAELCLLSKEPKYGFDGAKNRFEELQAAHQIQAHIIHGVGAFLPFHRYFIHAHETLLRTECGYEGTQPGTRYWDETRDAGRVSESDILDPNTGFGGDGVGERGCIADGPFAGYINSLGPGYKITDHCITRFVNNTRSLRASQRFIDRCYESDTFVDVWPCLESSPHLSGHGAISGLMMDPIASPGDPIFYLHHTWLDKVWWEWQAIDLPKRLTDIGGRNSQDGSEGFPAAPPTSGGPRRPTPRSAAGGDDGPGFNLDFPGGDDDIDWGVIDWDHIGFPSLPGGGDGAEIELPPGVDLPPDAMRPPEDAEPQEPRGDPGNETTLNHVLNLFGLVPDVTIREVMDIAGGLLCYEYV